MSADLDADDLQAGLSNLLDNCAGLSAGQSLLIVREDPALGWYDDAIAEAAARAAEDRGAIVRLFDVGGPQNTPLPGLAEAADAHDVVLFLARVGDQGRFEDAIPGKTRVMSYCRDVASLASPYGQAPHPAMVAVKQAVNGILLKARTVRISCPLGTDLTGELTAEERRSDADVGMARFPMGVHQPLPARAFTGIVAVTHHLTPTGSRVYDPPSIPLEEVVKVTLAEGRVTGMTGPDACVARMKAHHAHVAETFDLDPDRIHSWHAGIHPASGYPWPASDNPDRWSNTIFTNPRFLHFHTCYDTPPGEICWMVQDPTIVVDGTALWDAGVIQTDAFPALSQCLQDWPALGPLFANPVQEIGV